MIFVFGSNLAGIHGAGAAKFAHDNLGAKYRAAEGLMGYCYAIPTKDENIKSLSKDEISKYIQKFMKFAYDNPHCDFKVTQVGCGLAGFSKGFIAECFWYSAYKNSNCYFDLAWKNYLPNTAKFWGTF